jgi:hypothetical protein
MMSMTPVPTGHCIKATGVPLANGAESLGAISTASGS